MTFTIYHQRLSYYRVLHLYCISILVPLSTALHVLLPVQFQLGASVCNHTRDLSKTRAQFHARFAQFLIISFA